MKERVKELRKELKLTMEKFGERLGVGKTAISKIEKGENSLTDQMFKAICNVNWDGRYVNEEWLRGNSKKMFKADPGNELKALAEKYGLSDAAYVMVEKFVNLKPEAQETIFNYIREVAAAFQSEEIPPVADAVKAKPAAGTPSSVAESEATYEKSLGIVPRTGSSALNTIGGTAFPSGEAKERSTTGSGGGESGNDVG